MSKTPKIRRAAQIALENPTMPIKHVMLKAGYAPTSAINPSQLTESKGWKELMEEYLPDEYLQGKHREFIDTPRQVRRYVNGNMISETEETDPSAVKALEMAYKLKRKYTDINVGQAIFVSLPPEIAQKNALNQKTVERHTEAEI